MFGGLFEGGDGDDLVTGMMDGSFDGGDGSDRVTECIDSPPGDVVNVESIASVSCAELD